MEQFNFKEFEEDMLRIAELNEMVEDSEDDEWWDEEEEAEYHSLCAKHNLAIQTILQLLLPTGLIQLCIDPKQVKKEKGFNQIWTANEYFLPKYGNGFCLSMTTWELSFPVSPKSNGKFPVRPIYLLKTPKKEETPT